MGITSIKTRSLGSAKYWIISVDNSTWSTWSIFLDNKVAST